MACIGIPSSSIVCPPPQLPTNAKSLTDLVDWYKKKYDLHKSWDKKLSIPEAVFGTDYFSTQEFPKDVLNNKEWDSFFQKVKKGHPHQSRYYNKTDLRNIADYLAKHRSRNSFKDFEDLYNYVSNLLVKTSVNQKGMVNNGHALIIYDIALRLAYRYGVLPKKYVYLNGSGPFDGAKALGLGAYVKRRRISYSDIIKSYPELGELDAAQLEDFLCIFHKILGNYIKKII